MALDAGKALSVHTIRNDDSPAFRVASSWLIAKDAKQAEFSSRGIASGMGVSTSRLPMSSESRAGDIELQS